MVVNAGSVVVNGGIQAPHGCFEQVANECAATIKGISNARDVLDFGGGLLFSVGERSVKFSAPPNSNVEQIFSAVQKFRAIDFCGGEVGREVETFAQNLQDFARFNATFGSDSRRKFNV